MNHSSSVVKFVCSNILWGHGCGANERGGGGRQLCRVLLLQSGMRSQTGLRLCLASLGYLHTTALEHFRVHCAAFVVVSARMLTHSPSCSCDSYPREEIQNSNTATSMTTFECPEGGLPPPACTRRLSVGTSALLNARTQASACIPPLTKWPLRSFLDDEFQLWTPNTAVPKPDVPNTSMQQPPAHATGSAQGGGVPRGQSQTPAAHVPVRDAAEGYLGLVAEASGADATREVPRPDRPPCQHARF